MTTIARGELLYHGTQSKEEFEYPWTPAWFSDSEAVAENFVDWNKAGGRRRILVYEVDEPIEDLVLIETPHDMEGLVDRLIGSDVYGTHELAEALCDAGYNGWHVPWNYPSGSDTVLCEPERWLSFVEEIEL